MEKDDWINDTLKNINSDNEKEKIDIFNSIYDKTKEEIFNIFNFYDKTKLSANESIALVQGSVPVQFFHIISIWYFMWVENKNNGEKIT